MRPEASSTELPPDLTEELRQFLDAHRVGVLATIASDGQTAPVGRLLRARRGAAADFDRVETPQGSSRGALRVGFALHPRGSATVSVGHLLGPGRDPDGGHRPPTALITQRIAGTEEPPEAQSDTARAAIDRVILAITVDRVRAVTHLPYEG